MAQTLPSLNTHLPRRSRQVGLWEIGGMAIAALWNHKLRTGLTMLGMIIGIASVITITSLGQGVQQSTEQQLQSLGTNILQVRAGAARSGNVQQGTGSARTLVWEDALAIAEQVSVVEAASGYLQQNAQVVYGPNNTSTTVLGTDTLYANTRNIQLQEGRYFTQEELDAARPVAVMGATIRTTLLGREPAIGAILRIQGQQYEVIGVAQPKGSQGFSNPDEEIYIPLTNMSARLVGNNALAGISINGIVIKVRQQDQMDAAEFQITNLLRIRHDIYPPQADDFQVTNQADLISTFSTILASLTAMVVAIAGISLLVGGIGIANIMLVSVVERTREIGIRKAIGAKNSAILSQFLAEAVMIATVGGAIGIALGILLALLAATLLSIPFVVSILSIAASFGLSFLVGVLAGVIPARSAARLDPIAALRSD